MGIRFRCHHCEHELNLKEFQAGRRARCPVCSGRFRVPTVSTDFSIALEESEVVSGASLTAADARATATSRSEPTFQLGQPLNDPDSITQPRRSSSSSSNSSSSSSSSAAHAKAHGGSGASKANAKKSSGSKSTSTKPAPSKTPASTASGSKALTSSSPVASSSSVAAHATTPAQPSMPRAIAESPEAVWYVRPPSGGQYGPADGHVFYQWLIDSRVSPDSLVWRDGWPQWQSAGDAFEDHFGSAWRLASQAASEDEPDASPRSDYAALPGDITVRDSLGGGQGTVTDYVHEDSQGPVASAGPLALSTPAINSPVAVDATKASSPTLSVAEARRRKQRTQYGIMIAVLAVLAIALLAVFIMVIFGGAKVN